MRHRYLSKISVLTGSRDGPVGVLELLVFLETSSDILPQILHLSLVVRTEVIEVDLSPLQL